MPRDGNTHPLRHLSCQVFTADIPYSQVLNEGSGHTLEANVIISVHIFMTRQRTGSIRVPFLLPFSSARGPLYVRTKLSLFWSHAESRSSNLAKRHTTVSFIAEVAAD